MILQWIQKTNKGGHNHQRPWNTSLFWFYRELKRQKIAEQQALKQEARENKLQSLRERGLAVEIKENRVQFISEKDIVRKQKTNLKTQEILYKREKELQKLVERGEKGSEDKIADLIKTQT